MRKWWETIGIGATMCYRIFGSRLVLLSSHFTHTSCQSWILPSGCTPLGLNFLKKILVGDRGHGDSSSWICSETLGTHLQSGQSSGWCMHFQVLSLLSFALDTRRIKDCSQTAGRGGDRCPLAAGLANFGSCSSNHVAASFCTSAKMGVWMPCSGTMVSAFLPCHRWVTIPPVLLLKILKWSRPKQKKEQETLPKYGSIKPSLSSQLPKGHD